MKEIPLIDSHAHLSLRAFDKDREDVIERAKQAGVEIILTIGITPEDTEKAISISERHDFIFFSAGLHPHDAKHFDADAEKSIRSKAEHPKCLAIGEIGLDFHHNYSPPEKQVDAFRKQIAVARELALPIIVHSRESLDKTIQVLEEENAGEVGGIFHCFSGGPETVKKCLDLGFGISIAGPLTFKKAVKPVEVAEQTSLEHILLETDCPFLAPVPFRGMRNEPSYVLETYKRLSEIKKVPLEELKERLLHNFRKRFPKFSS
jgi:TatD DNase family protein